MAPSSINLEGKCILVTGAGSGIGRSAASLFAASGARVGCVDIDSAAGSATVDAIVESGGEALFMETDVSRGEDVARAINSVRDAWGGLDGLFNVVGVSGRQWGDGPVHECTDEAWDRLMEVNLKSVFHCCKHGIAAMLAAGSGSIVNLSSVLGLVGGDDDFSTHAYATTKGGIISLTRSIASYYAPRGIRANVICPGLIATGMSRRAQSNEHIRERLGDLHPLTGDFGQPQDVAHAALYLLSDAASFVTGAVLTVDGGWTVR